MIDPYGSGMGTETNPDQEQPRTVVEEFFDRMADDTRRDAIDELFDVTATIALPGATFEGADAPGAFLEYLEPRYKSAEKEFGRWIESGSSVVSTGTLHGVDNDGNSFNGVRYVDVYEVREGKIVRLDIWNDLLEDGVVDR